MSLKIKFAVLTDNGDIYDDGVFSDGDVVNIPVNRRLDVCEIAPDIIPDNVIPDDVFGNETYHWDFTIGQGTNAEPSSVVSLNGAGPHNVIFYDEGWNTIYLTMTQELPSTSGLVSTTYYASIDVYVYQMDIMIHGADYVKIGSEDIPYFVKEGAGGYLWTNDETTSNIELDFYLLKDVNLKCQITHGQRQQNLFLFINVTIGSTVKGERINYKVEPNLMFFNKEGDNLNFEYVEHDDNEHRWEGDLIFDENSDDTFRTIGLYTLERVAPISVSRDELPENAGTTSNDLVLDSLNLVRYQLFNEYGMDFIQSRVSGLYVTNIEKAINVDGFYSKWVYGDNFNLKYKPGSEVWFENIKFTNGTPNDFESKENDTWKTFTVLNAKADAILVLTDTENIFWDYTYDTENPGQIYSANFTRIWHPDYIDPEWNEQGFRTPGLTGIYDKKKLTYKNTQKNDGVYTVNFRENDTDLPYKNKFVNIDYLDMLDLPAGFGFEVELQLLTTRVFVTNQPVDIIPASIMDPFLNRKNLMFFDWTRQRDRTPTILQDETEFTFEPDGINANFNYIYKVIRRSPAQDILDANDSDRKGWTITATDVRSSLTDPPTIVIENADTKTQTIETFNVKLIENEAFQLEINNLETTGETTLTLEGLASIINVEIGEQATGIVTKYESGSVSVLINESQGWIIKDTTISSVQDRTGITSTRNNPTDGKLPTIGVLGTRIVTLDQNTLGYIYRRTRTNSYHIQVDYDATNELPIWYTLDELQTTLWIEATGALTYMQNAQQSLFLTDTKIQFPQQWSNEELLTAIKNVDLETLDPDAQIFKDIAAEQLSMFQNFVVNWGNTFDFYGIELYVQTDTNKWDSDIIYNEDDYTKFKGIFYQSLVDNNKENQPDQSSGEWEELPYFVLLACARKYTLNAEDNQTPELKDDYMKVTFRATDFENVLVPLEQSQNLLEAYQYEVLEELSDEYNKIYGKYDNQEAVSVRSSRRVIIDDIDEVFGLVIKVNDIPYPVPYDNIPTEYPPDIDRTFDIQETLFDWGNMLFMVDQDIISPEDDSDVGLKYYQQLESIGIIVWLERSGEKDDFFGTSGLAAYDTVVFQGKYPNIDFTIEIIGTNNRHRIRHSNIEFFEIGDILTITINGIPYSATGSNTQDTVTKWVKQWQVEIVRFDILVQERENAEFPTIEFFTLDDDTRIEYEVWAGLHPSPSRRLFNIINWKPGKEGIIITGNQVLNLIPGLDFERALFATGMIVSVGGSKWSLNNQEYNILLVDPLVLGLSYQGAFWNSSDQFGESFDDTDVDPDEPGRQEWDWEAVSDPVVTFEVADFLRLERVNDVGVEVASFQITYKETSLFELKDIFSWKWQFGDGESLTVFNSTLTAGTNGVAGTNGLAEALRLATHEYETTGAYTVSLTLSLITGDIIGSAKVYIITNDMIIARGPRVFDNIELNTREYLRFPREGYNDETKVRLVWSWLDDTDIEDSTIFFYDFSGLQLEDEGILTYTGVEPLVANGDPVFLNTEENRDITKVKDPSYQQTVFDQLSYTLETLDSEVDITFETEPLQMFMGYNAPNEGVDQRTLVLSKHVETVVVIETSKIESNNPAKVLPISEYKNVVYFISELNQIKIERFEYNLAQSGLRIGQNIRINAYDNTQNTGQATFTNSGLIVKIENIGIDWILLTSSSEIYDEISYKVTQEAIAPYQLVSISFTIELIVEPLQIAQINILGQTEIEDDRYRTMQWNLGVGVMPTDSFIFAEYDVNEKGVDWTYINRKRKEMLFNFPEIYNYISAYKSTINAINYFGYNELEFNEYYRNVDKNSPRYKKLEKILIPDLFNNQVEGYHVNDFIIGTMPNDRYYKTNLFNLAYQITDNYGNNILAFSLDEIVVKLIGLKRWLNNTTIPIGRRILDITGKTINTYPFWLIHDSKHVTQFKIKQDISPVDFTIEAYLQPIVNSSDTYNVHLEFFTVDDTTPDYFQLSVITFSTEENTLSDNFKMDAIQIINEFKTDMNSYNFTADSTVDPFIMVEITTDNGYGQIYKNRRTYSLQSFAFLN